ncbi:hypothetical protein BHE74_00003278 [Ensete ventricosum]|nr:hypothetical protein GW17_00004929 [Ensete ventricosum]RWW87863.1 hypothetical protein BHE74_00003278 [Ensete ventricosum]RZS00622.1 hypothetical protein BHM03_00030399 [Ensete ventricosum]
MIETEQQSQAHPFAVRSLHQRRRGQEPVTTSRVRVELEHHPSRGSGGLPVIAIFVVVVDRGIREGPPTDESGGKDLFGRRLLPPPPPFPLPSPPLLLLPPTRVRFGGIRRGRRVVEDHRERRKRQKKARFWGWRRRSFRDGNHLYIRKRGEGRRRERVGGWGSLSLLFVGYCFSCSTPRGESGAVG